MVDRTVDKVETADRAALTAVILGGTAFAVAQGLTYPLISLVLEARGVSSLASGLNAASFAAGLALATLFIRTMTASISGDRLIVLALFGCSLSLGLFWLLDPLWVWFLARLSLGFSAGTVFIVSEAWMHTACPDSIRGRVSGLYGFGICIGFAGGPLAIPLLGSENSLAFGILCIYVAMVAFMTALLGRRARTAPSPVPSGALLNFIRAAPFLIVIVGAFGYSDIAAISSLPVYFVRTGHSEAFAAVAVTIMALPTAFAQPFIGILLDRFPKMRVAIAMGVLGSLTFLILPWLHSETLILIDFALMGAATFALNTCAQALLGERFTGGLLVAGSAVFSLAYAAGSGAGSAISGLTMEIVPAAAPLTIGAGLLAMSLLFAIDRSGRRTLERRAN